MHNDYEPSPNRETSVPQIAHESDFKAILDRNSELLTNGASDDEVLENTNTMLVQMGQAPLYEGETQRPVMLEIDGVVVETLIDMRPDDIGTRVRPQSELIEDGFIAPEASGTHETALKTETDLGDTALDALGIEEPEKSKVDTLWDELKADSAADRAESEAPAEQLKDRINEGLEGRLGSLSDIKGSPAVSPETDSDGPDMELVRAKYEMFADFITTLDGKLEEFMQGTDPYGASEYIDSIIPALHAIRDNTPRPAGNETVERNFNMIAHATYDLFYHQRNLAEIAKASGVNSQPFREYAYTMKSQVIAGSVRELGQLHID